MIRALRLRHRILAPAMLLASLASIAVAVIVRPSRMSPSAPVPDPAAGPATPVPDLGVELRMSREPDGWYSIGVRSTGPLRVPDPLLYAIASVPSDSTRLPDDAVFLGSVAGQFRGATRLETPPHGRFLAIWSNGYRRIEAVAPFDFATATRR